VSSKTTPSGSPDEVRAILALTLVAEVGSVAHRQLSERFRSARQALDAAFSPDVRARAYTDADEFLRTGERRGLQLMTQLDSGYPATLRELHDPPATLWSRGNWTTLRAPMVAVVGTRRATSYGQRITRELAGALARAGACVVSGMAHGIDAYAHRAALDAGGSTIAVLGNGADVVYPRANTALYREIVERGLVLSELPPGIRSGAWAFPRRNRIIAALSALTIVVEAPKHSGALNTSKHALELGRDIAAVPGPIDSPQSEGANELIRDGAHAITSVADALALVGLEPPVKIAPELHGADEERVWNALIEGSATLDELCARTTLPVAECLAAVTALEVRNVVECALTGEIRRR
jgi:DNA processing protein